MPSEKPLIALRVEQELYDKIAAMAHQQGRTAGNLVAYMLRVQLKMTPAVTDQPDMFAASRSARSPKRAKARKK